MSIFQYNEKGVPDEHSIRNAAVIGTIIAAIFGAVFAGTILFNSYMRKIQKEHSVEAKVIKESTTENMTYRLTVQTAEGQIYTVSIKNEYKSPVEILADSIKEGDTVRFPTNSSAGGIKAPIGTLTSGLVEIVETAEKKKE